MSVTKIDISDLKKFLLQKVDYAVYKESVLKIETETNQYTIFYKNGGKFVFSFQIIKPGEEEEDSEAV